MEERVGYALILIASTLWGTMSVLAKLAFSFGIDPIVLTAFRQLISFSILCFILLVINRKAFSYSRRDIFTFLVLGAFGVGIQRITYLTAVNVTTASMATLLFFTYPIFVTFYSVSVFKEKISYKVVVSTILTFVGVAFTVKVYDVSALKINFWGIFAGILSSILFSVYFILAKKLRRKYQNWTITLYGDGIGTVILVPTIISSTSEISKFGLELWILIFTIALVSSLLAYSFYSKALKYVRPSQGSILSVMEPLTAVFLSTIFLSERFEILQIIGITLAILGVLILFIGRKEISVKTIKNLMGHF